MQRRAAPRAGAVPVPRPLAITTRCYRRGYAFTVYTHVCVSIGALFVIYNLFTSTLVLKLVTMINGYKQKPFKA